MMNKIALSITDKIIVLSNIDDGRWFAIRNKFRLSNCRGILLDIKCGVEILGSRLYEALMPVIIELSKEEPKDTYDKLPFHHLILNTTYKCNLSCKYCYFAANSSGTSMSANLIEHSIKKCLNSLDEKSELTVLFQGGEALIEYDAIKKALESIGSNSRIHYQMQTNGTLITKEIMDFFEKYRIHVSFSLDSHLEKHNNLRSTKTDIFTKKIFDVCKMFHDRKMDYGLISVVCENNLEDLQQMFFELVEKGINTFAYNLMWPIGRAKDEKLESLISTPKQLAQMMYQVYKTIYKYNVDDGYAPFQKYRERNLYMLWHRLFYRKLSNYMCMNTPCGAGINSLTVDTDGNVYPCALMLPSIESGFEIGNIYSDSIDDLVRRDSIVKHRDLNKIEKCKNCTYKAICSGGGCGIAFYHFYGDINANSFYCDYYYELLNLMIEDAMDRIGTQTIKNY